MMKRQKLFQVAAAAPLESRRTDTETQTRRLTPSGEAAGEREVQMDRSHLRHPGRPPVSACRQNRKSHRGTSAVRFRVFARNLDQVEMTHMHFLHLTAKTKSGWIEKIKRVLFCTKIPILAAFYSEHICLCVCVFQDPGRPRWRQRRRMSWAAEPNLSCDTYITFDCINFRPNVTKYWT